MGAVLTQLDDNQVEHPVSYHSQKFNKYEKKYSTVEIELLGMILAQKHFNFYLNGSSFPHRDMY